MIKLLIYNTFPAPYRADLFKLISKKYDTDIFYDRSSDSGRNKKWIDNDKNYNYYILEKKEDKKIIKNKIKKIKEYDFVIIYEYSTLSAMKLMLKCIANKVPYFINCDGAIIHSNFLKDKIKKFFIKRAYVCLANGKSAEQYFLKYGAKNENIYFHNFSSLHKKDILDKPISMEAKTKLKKDLGIKYKRNFISVGSFIKRKGFDLIIEALKNSKNKQNNDIGFTIIGEGEELENYKQKIKEYKIRNITFISFKTKMELFKYYDASEVFVLPTREDIWGLVINEAMARGLPVITTDKCVAGLELIDNEINGNIFKNESVNELSELIEKYSKKSNEELIKFGEISIAKIKDYTIENIAKAHIELIENISQKIKF